MKNLPRYTVIALIGSPLLYIFASLAFLGLSIINFPDNWFLGSVSMMYGFESTKYWYVFILSLCVISSAVTFVILILNVKIKLTKFQKSLLFPPVIFTALYSYFNLSDYEFLHYIFASSAVLSVFVMQYFFSSLQVKQNEVLKRNSRVFIVIEFLSILLSYVIFKELVIIFEIIFVITLSLWIIVLLIEDAKESSLTNNIKTGKM